METSGTRLYDAISQLRQRHMAPGESVELTPTQIGYVCWFLCDHIQVCGRRSEQIGVDVAASEIRLTSTVLETIDAGFLQEVAQPGKPRRAIEIVMELEKRHAGCSTTMFVFPDSTLFCHLGKVLAMGLLRNKENPHFPYRHEVIAKIVGRIIRQIDEEFAEQISHL